MRAPKLPKNDNNFQALEFGDYVVIVLFIVFMIMTLIHIDSI